MNYTLTDSWRGRWETGFWEEKALSQACLGSFCLTVGNTGLAPALGLEAQAWSNWYGNSGCLCALACARRQGESKTVGRSCREAELSPCKGKCPNKRICQGSASRSPEFPRVGGKQGGGGSRQPHGRDILELFPKCGTCTSGRMPDDFRWCIDQTLNHTESHSEKVIFLSISFFFPSPPIEC